MDRMYVISSITSSSISQFLMCKFWKLKNSNHMVFQSKIIELWITLNSTQSRKIYFMLFSEIFMQPFNFRVFNLCKFFDICSIALSFIFLHSVRSNISSEGHFSVKFLMPFSVKPPHLAKYNSFSSK
jgi:hypothetical protein